MTVAGQRTPSIRNTTLNLLARREHSQFELANKLKQRGFSLLEIEQVLAECAQQNIQSDQRFAEAYIRARTNRGYGPIRIQQDLQSRGVAESMIQSSMKQVDLDWSVPLTRVKEKKFGAEVPDDNQQRAKQIRFLRYRGFYLEDIMRLY